MEPKREKGRQRERKGLREREREAERERKGVRKREREADREKGRQGEIKGGR